MKRLLLSIVAIAMVVAVAACGASGRDVAKAKTTRYQGDKLALFELAKAATAAKHGLAVTDETALRIITKPRWYTPEGLAANFDGGDIQLLQDKSLKITLGVSLLPEGQSWIVHVESEIFRYNRGMPNLEPVKASNLDVPGWAQGKVDELAVAIHEALKPYEVKSPGGVVPAPAEPAPAPAEGSATEAAPAEGSAATP